MKINDFVLAERMADILYQVKLWWTTVPFAFTVTPFVAYFEKYVFSDWETFAIIMSVFMMDTVVGVYKHLRKRTLSREGFGKFFDKFVVCCGSLFLANKFAMLGEANELWSQLTIAFGKSALIVYLSISIAENMSEITGGKFPPKWVINKLKFFSKPKGKEEDADKEDVEKKQW